MQIVDQKVELIDSMGSDLSVVNAARVSFHKESDWEMDGYTTVQDFVQTYVPPVLSEKDQKLIVYLAKHGHWTPFGHAFLSFRIKAPIFVARQLVKHTVGLVWNEVSRRYVDDEPEFWFPKVWRGKPVNAKQGSSEETLYKMDGERTTRTHIGYAVESATEEALALYLDMIDAGVAPEQARMVLPQNMMTEWIWSGSLMAFARVCKLRLDPHAQAETREIAEYIDLKVRQLATFNYSWAALLG